MRLDRRILELHPDFSRSRIEGLIKAGFVSVNGMPAAKAGMNVGEGDDIHVEIPPPVPAEPEPEDIPLDIVFEDDDIVVINKPPGLVVHPAPGHFSGTLVNALLHRCPELAELGCGARPGIVHRLDQDTSGLIVVAKTSPAMAGLAKAFASHGEVSKTYIAVCHGRPPALSGRIENLIVRKCQGFFVLHAVEIHLPYVVQQAAIVRLFLFPLSDVFGGFIIRDCKGVDGCVTGVVFFRAPFEAAAAFGILFADFI